VKITRETKEKNKEISENIQKWLSAIEVNGHIDSLTNNDERQLAWNLLELLEKCLA